jgi:signal transduction histidine kinase/ABC-type uncharacterized transport system substrate-binding protein
MMTRISVIVAFVWLLALMMPTGLSAQESRARSILFLDQSDFRGSFYQSIFSALRDAVNGDIDSHITLYRENLDLSRFSGESYQESLRRYLKEKYRDKPLGVIVAVGAATFEFVQRWRAELWPGAPVVFALLDETDRAEIKQSTNLTGGLVRLRLADAITAARDVVPNLDTVVFIGDEWQRQVVFKHWREEIPEATAGLNVVELVGLPMTELRQRVTGLPDRSVIIYSAIYSDGAGAFYPPAVALRFIAERANRPIIVASETFLEPGGIGGFVLQPSKVGADAAQRAIRILNGEPASAIPVTAVSAVNPIFSWKQMQRWQVSESDLPPGSEVRFREASFWQQYRWQSTLIAAALLVQAGLILVLLHERRRRGAAETEARQRLSEMAHVHRQALAGQLSSSIAHELNQPLGAILTNAETAEVILNSPDPDLSELKEIVADIRDDDMRASQVIAHMRSLLKRTPYEEKEIDINEIMHEAFDLMSARAAERNVALHLKTWTGPLRVKGDQIQLQQVIINLIANGMDAVAVVPFGRIIIGATARDGSRILLSISDSGPGVAADELGKVFDPFFTTKAQGLGVGLSIARTIVDAHKGLIWVENRPEGGAVFWISLPLSIS